MNKIKLLERPIRRDRRRRIEDNEARPVFWEVLQRDRAVARGVAIKSREELGKGGHYSLFVVRAFIHLRSLLIVCACHVVSRHWGVTKLTRAWARGASSESFHSSRKRPTVNNNKHSNKSHNVWKWYALWERRKWSKVRRRGVQVEGGL